MNPRYPHSILIERTTGTYDPFNGGATGTDVIYTGVGRNYKAGASGKRDGVIYSDFEVSIPKGDVHIQAGDNITVVDRVRTIKGLVVDAYNGNLGCTVYWDKDNN